MDAARVLLVDDDELIRASVSQDLSRRGYDVTTCAEGLPALVEIRKAHHRGRPFRTVVLDAHLPDIDGNQMLATIKASYPDTPVLLISGFGSEALQRAVDGTPGSSYLAKPFATQALVDTIELLAPPPEPLSVPSKERRGQPTLHATAHLLIGLEPDVDPDGLVLALYRLEGLCYVHRVQGRWDLVALVQGLDRSAIAKRLKAWRNEHDGVRTVTVIHARQPLVEPDLWPVLVDAVGAPSSLEPPRHAASPPGDAFVVLEVKPEHLVECYVRACLMDDVIQCDTGRDRGSMILLVRSWTGEGDPMRVPDRIRLMPGVLRARALPIVEPPATPGGSP